VTQSPVFAKRRKHPVAKIPELALPAFDFIFNLDKYRPYSLGFHRQELATQEKITQFGSVAVTGAIVLFGIA